MSGGLNNPGLAYLCPRRQFDGAVNPADGIAKGVIRQRLGTSDLVKTLDFGGDYFFFLILKKDLDGGGSRKDVRDKSIVIVSGVFGDEFFRHFTVAD